MNCRYYKMSTNNTYSFIGFWILMFISTYQLYGQNAKLAGEYYKNGEYEKSSSIYLALNKKHPNNSYYFDRYIYSLIELQDYQVAENAIHAEIKKNPKNAILYINLGELYDKQNQPDQADKTYVKAIDKMPAELPMIQRIASAFSSRAKYALAIKAYEKGQKLLKDPTKYHFQLADLYRQEGDTDKMITSYLYSLIQAPTRIRHIQTYFQRFLTSEEFDSLLPTLYDFTSEYPDVAAYPEMLEWIYITKRDYRNAFRQAKALDTRLQENGHRIYNVAQIALNQKDYDSAILGFEHIVTQKTASSAYYMESQRELLKTKQFKITSNPNYTTEDLLDLEVEYGRFLETNTRKAEAASIMRQYAKFQSYYLKNHTRAKEILTELIETPGVNKFVKANAKLDLGDIFLIQDEIWEASLLYSQVDKEFTEDLIGQTARFKNAKLSYYNGDFEWAQTQFKVLKTSTSKLISNDALDLSVFIQDNLGLDTTAIPMEIYAKADFLTVQNKYKEAFQLLDVLKKDYPEHGLLDDIYYLEANLHVKKRAYDLAIEKYNFIIENYEEDIRADNSLYQLALLYDDILGKPEMAQPLYEKIFVDYSNSVFTVDSRKRYRNYRSRVGQTDKKSDVILDEQ